MRNPTRTIIEDAPRLDPALLRKVNIVPPSTETQPIYMGTPVHQVPVPVLITKEVLASVIAAIRGEKDIKKAEKELTADRYTLTQFTAENGAMVEATVIPELRSINRLLLPAALTAFGFDNKFTDLLDLQYGLMGDAEYFNRHNAMLLPPIPQQAHIRDNTRARNDAKTMSINALATIAVGLMTRLDTELSPLGATTCHIQDDEASELIAKRFLENDPRYSLGHSVTEGTVSVKKNEILTDLTAYQRPGSKENAYYHSIQRYGARTPQ